MIWYNKPLFGKNIPTLIVVGFWFVVIVAFIAGIAQSLFGGAP